MLLVAGSAPLQYFNLTGVLFRSIGNFSEFSYRTKPSGGCALRRTR